MLLSLGWVTSFIVSLWVTWDIELPIIKLLLAWLKHSICRRNCHFLLLQKITFVVKHHFSIPVRSSFTCWQVKCVMYQTGYSYSHIGRQWHNEWGVWDWSLFLPSHEFFTFYWHFCGGFSPNLVKIYCATAQMQLQMVSAVSSNGPGSFRQKVTSNFLPSLARLDAAIEVTLTKLVYNSVGEFINATGNPKHSMSLSN